jgi:hypothetical protein
MSLGTCDNPTCQPVRPIHHSSGAKPLIQFERLKTRLVAERRGRKGRGGGGKPRPPGRTEEIGQRANSGTIQPETAWQGRFHRPTSHKPPAVSTTSFNSGAPATLRAHNRRKMVTCRPGASTASGIARPRQNARYVRRFAGGPVPAAGAFRARIGPTQSRS